MTDSERALIPLVDWASQVRYEDIPAPVREQARLIIYDLLAAIWAGKTEAEVAGLAHWANANQWLFEPLWQGCILGTSAVALEMDEGNRRTLGHPGSHVAPVMLAHLRDIPSFEEFLRVFVVAYEVSARIARCGRPRPDAHPHGTWGTVGSAVAMALLASHDLRDTILLASSTTIATAFTAALEGRTVRNLYAGLSALVGSLATQWSDVVAGIFAPTETMFSTWSGQALTEGLGTHFAVSENYFKTIAACRYVHGTVEAIENLRDELPLSRVHVDQVVVETYAPASQLSGLPHNTLSSKFSLPYAILKALEGKARDPRSFHEPLELTAEQTNLLRHIVVKENEEFTDLLPEVRKTRVQIHYTMDGHTSIAVDEVDLPMGEWDRPFPPDMLFRKWQQVFSDLPSNVLPELPSDLSLESLRRFTTAFFEAVLLKKSSAEGVVRR